MIRIAGGIHRGRTLVSPRDDNTRPTSDRARESIFNILRHGRWHDGVLDGATVLDVFSGTGALGLEALSQGAAQAVFIELDGPASELCRSNIERLEETGRARVLTCNALAPYMLPHDLEPRSLVFLDPPYGRHMGALSLKALAARDWLTNDAVCVMEMSKKIPEIIPPGFTLMDERSYGIAKIHFLRRTM